MKQDPEPSGHRSAASTGIYESRSAFAAPGGRSNSDRSNEILEPQDAIMVSPSRLTVLREVGNLSLGGVL